MRSSAKFTKFELIALQGHDNPMKINFIERHFVNGTRGIYNC